MLTEAEARAQLAAMVAAHEEPKLDAGEIDELLQLAARPDWEGNPPAATWEADTPFVTGDRVEPPERNGHLYEATTTGRTSAREPVWPTATGGTVVDGAVTWKEVGTSVWLGRWDLGSAASEGWRRKAGKAAGKYRFSMGGDGLDRQQIFDRCLRMAERYASSRLVSAPLITDPATAVDLYDLPTA